MDNEDLNKDFKNNPFKVPENYFETFDSRVMDRLYKKQHKMGLWRNLKKWGIAASLFIAAGVGVYLYNNQTQAIDVIDIASTNINAVELDKFQNDVEVSDDEFMELLKASITI